MKNIANYIGDMYWGVPRLTKKLLPLVIAEHLVASFCLNVSAFFKQIDHLQYGSIGQFISIYYWGCFVGAILGGTLTMYLRTTKVTGLGLIILSGCLYTLLYSTNSWLIGLAMLGLGVVGTSVATSNFTSLVRSAKQNEQIRLKIISLELVLFNLSYSLVTFVLLDLSRDNIYMVLKAFILVMPVLGLYSFFVFKDEILGRPNLKIQGIKRFIPESKMEFLALMSMLLCFGLIYSMVKVVFNPTLIDRFGTNLLSVTAASINPWALFIFQPILIERIKNSNSVMFLGAGGLIVGMSYFAFGIIDSFAVTVGVLVMLTLGEILFSPLSKHFLIKLYKDGQEGVASGMWRTVFLGSGVIGSEMSGYVAQHSGALMVWEFCALSGLSCFAISLILRKMKNSSQQIVMA